MRHAAGCLRQTESDAQDHSSADAATSDPVDTDTRTANEIDSDRDPAIESVLTAIQATDIDETPPVELMAKVQRWQEQLSETELSEH